MSSVLVQQLARFRQVRHDILINYLGLKLGDVVDWEESQEKGKKYARIRKLE